MIENIATISKIEVYGAKFELGDVFQNGYSFITQTHKKKELGRLLWAISDLLNACSEKIRRGTLPTEESHQLVIIIAASRAIARKLKARNRIIDLGYIFEVAIPKTGKLLRD